MEKDFQQFIESNNLCDPSDRILLGLSGGIDSICLFHLFRLLNFPIGVAHCNFKLRGDESDQDEIFVRDLTNKYDIPFFHKQFNTKEIATEEGISIQMTARDLRYDWFEQTRQKFDYKFIAIAHNRDDVIETFLINLARGSGIKGLTGIKVKINNIIRPLLFASRKDIVGFIHKNNYEYREDSSNQSTKYSRNLLRHEIIPLFEKINPRFRETMIENITKLKETKQVYLKSIDKVKQSILLKKNEKIYIKINELKKLNPLHSYTFELLYPFGFTNSQIDDIIEALDGISGKQFYSLTHRLIKDRDELILEEISGTHNLNYFIEFKQEIIDFPIKLKFVQIEVDDNFELSKSNHIGFFDIEKLEFPLVLRKWKTGDYFMPLGMRNLKKLSDFFIDRKFSIADKESTWILESNNKIIWIIGHQIDERFKISNVTKSVYKVEYIHQ